MSTCSTARPPGASACPSVCLCAGPAARHHPHGVRRRRDPAQRRAATGRPRPRGPAVRRPAVARSATPWSTQIDAHHGGSPTADAALAAITAPADALAADAGLDPDARSRPGRHPQRRAARRRGPVPRAMRRPTIWWSTSRTSRPCSTRCGARAPRASRCRINGSSRTSAPRCVGNTLLLNGRTYSPPYVVTAIGDASAHAGGARRGAAGHALQAVRGAVRARLHRGADAPSVERGRLPAADPDALRQARRVRSGTGRRGTSSLTACGSSSSTTTTASSSTWSSTWGSSASTRTCGATTTRAWPTDAAVADAAEDVRRRPAEPWPRHAGAGRRVDPAGAGVRRRRRRRCSVSASGTRPSASRSAAPSTARPSCCTARPAACTTRMSVCCKDFRTRSPRRATTR